MSLILAIAVAASCSDDAAGPPAGATPRAVANFTFLTGTWIVQGELGTDAGVSAVTAVATVQASLGDRAHKERWIGRRAGQIVEVLSLYGRSERAGAWLIARADGRTGAFDVLEGSFSGNGGTFTTRSGSRPDAGRERVRYDSITDAGFRMVAERSTDGGAGWTAWQTLRYTRASGTPAIETAPDPAPGCTSIEHRQFDFWIGAWAVGGARSDINRLLGGCVIDENWSSPSETGTSFSMYDGRSGRWAQLWIDTNDNTLFIQGGLEDGRLQMRNANNRITWTALAAGTVRQLGENAADGINWNTIYDLIYVPR